MRLYEKIGHRLRLTPAAEILLPYSRDLLAEHEAVIAAMDEWRGLKRGIVRIGAGPATSVYLLPGLLRKYRRAFPKVDMFVETGNSPALIEKLQEGSLDLALLASSNLPEEPNLVVEKSWPMEFAFVSSLENVPRRCKISELSKIPFILFRKGSRMQNVIDHYFTEMNFHPKVVMSFDNADAIKAMIRAGLGVSLLPLWIVDADLRKGVLRLIHQQERPLFSKFDLLRRKSSYTPNPVASFIELTQKHRFPALQRK